MKIYALVIDTDQYAGNFEREMTSYCTNLEFPRGQEYITDDVENAAWWENNTCEYSKDSDDYPEGCSIWVTPGWSNDGRGKHVRLADGQSRAYPAYMSVAMFCSKHPPREVIDEVWKRAQEFNAVYQKSEQYWAKHAPITVEKIRLVAIEEIVTETEIDVS